MTLDVKNFPPAVIFNCEKPVICALNDAAAGFGMDMALACDIRIMAEGAKMAPTPVKRGIVPESGGTWILPRLVGWEKATEIFFTARNLGAAESKELGLCAHVVPDAELMVFAASGRQALFNNCSTGHLTSSCCLSFAAHHPANRSQKI